MSITATTDPDKDWTVYKNPDYSHTAWDQSADGTYEERLNRESLMDEFSGINWNKIPNKSGEYYSLTKIPLLKYEFDEEEYYNNLIPKKTDEQLLNELNEPLNKLNEKLIEFENNKTPFLWTPALQQMTDNTIKQARQIEYEISPYFQLNKEGLRKNWATIRVCELRPLERVLNSNNQNFFMDYFYRFQQMRWRLTSRMRLRYWKMAIHIGAVCLIMDHFWAREYRRSWKWH